MDLVTYLLAKKNGGGGGSADVTAAAVASAIGSMNSTQKASSRTALGAAQEPMVVEITESSGTYSASESLADIQAAIAAGREVYAVNAYGAEAHLFGQESGGLQFAAFDDSNGGSVVTLRVYTISSSGVSYEGVVFVQEPTRETVTGTEVSITPQDNRIYTCGELTSLTIGSTAVSGDWTVIFTSGTTPTTFNDPSWLTMPDDFQVEANRRYEISVSNGYALVGSWAVSSS